MGLIKIISLASSDIVTWSDETLIIRRNIKEYNNVDWFQSNTSSLAQGIYVELNINLRREK